MTLNQYCTINWQRGNKVRLTNGKEYVCKAVLQMGKWLLLYSEEYDAYFGADYRIIDCRTSDYEEPEEIYLQHKAAKRAAAEAKIAAERLRRQQEKEALKQQHLREQEEAHRRKMARKLQQKQEKEAKRHKVEANKGMETSSATKIPVERKKRPRIHTVRVVNERVKIPKEINAASYYVRK